MGSAFSTTSLTKTECKVNWITSIVFFVTYFSLTLVILVKNRNKFNRLCNTIFVFLGTGICLEITSTSVSVFDGINANTCFISPLSLTFITQY